MSRLRAFEVRDGTFAMLHDGEYELSVKAKTVYWFLLYHGIWEPGHEWFGHVDIKMTSNSTVSMATGWSEQSVRRAMSELESKEFIARKERLHPHSGVRLNDSIELGTPPDWCQSCHKRGTHMCSRGA